MTRLPFGATPADEPAPEPWPRTPIPAAIVDELHIHKNSDLLEALDPLRAHIEHPATIAEVYQNLAQTVLDAFHRRRCPGLNACPDHPRWRVWRDRRGYWHATPAHNLNSRAFPTHAQAINYAQHIVAPFADTERTDQ